jgi:hypothetical protein
MEPTKPTFDELLVQARKLSPLDKLRLIEGLTPDLGMALAAQSLSAGPTERRSLRGILKGCNIGDAEIREVRQEMWGGFPREAC